jgi:hypothetical protein
VDDIEPQFGNNFFMLFSGMRDVARGEQGEQFFHDVYLGKAERLGAVWEGFVAENQDLISKIYGALDVKDIYSHLMDEYVRLLKADRSGAAADKLDAATGHPLGLTAVSMFVWDGLNPLLEEAAERMSEAGIDPKQFYG